MNKVYAFRSRQLQPTLARLPPLTSLRAFVAAARHLSFTQAADELHVTSAAIGQQIRLLEDHLGQALFHRNRGKLQLTEAGLALMPGLTSAFEAVVESVARLSGYEDDAPLKVSVPPSFAGRWLLPRLDALKQAAPDLEIVVDASADHVDLASEDMDCVIRYGTGSFPGLTVERLFAEAVAPVCSPAFAHAHGLHRGPEALRGAPVIHDDGPERDPTCPDWPSWLRSAGLPGQLVSGGLRLNQSSLVLDAAIAGQGIALGKLRLAEGDIEAGRLVQPLGPPRQVEFSYFFAALPHKAKLARVDLFRSWLLAEARALRALDQAPPPFERPVPALAHH
ncbi:transcriptional regulator GcvA [Kaistia dalseonensis]|uniref:LysR family glycine cleavage system transcriptional activator n=1 Tax=Kaistia dalseonensis TaxID=410840 RepID=A0ABU0H1T0_9HYPH|nr:transcriptional regulator GcvA [Kaistia dalseonensis]MCX5493705.1 transcriptional regulator GcvA [Kaistia dalseonensis]MDQ0436268.1 LysR family glycine cleavage system transcriptional activator [Kaistia dalseonensis]